MANNKLDRNVGASIQSEKQADGKSYKYYLVLQHAGGQERNEISYETAAGLIQKAGDKHVSQTMSTDAGASYVFDSKFAAQNIINPLEKAAGKDVKYTQHSAEAAKPKKPPLEEETSLIGKTKVTDVTDEINTAESNVDRRAGKIDTGVNASSTVIPNDVGKGGAGGTKGAGFESDGEGANSKDAGTGLGIGSGNGSGIGDGSGDGDATFKSGGYNSDGSNIGTAAVTDTPDTGDTEAIASYLATINGEPVVNHIFHNDFYTTQPISHWAFSVDFIPTITSDSLSQTDLFSIGQILTKAVQTVTVPERQIQSTVSHYKGMTIELPARAKTCGTLNMKFAENNAFMVSTVLNTLFQFARSDDYFENIDYKLEAMQPENDDQMKLAKQILRAYRAALPKGGHLFNILVKMYRMQDTRALDDVDSSQYPTFVYFYKGCDLKSVKQIEFNYEDDKPIDVPCEWVYQFFEEMTFDEYLQRYGSAAEDDVASKEEAVDDEFKPFDDSDLPSAQEGIDNLINDAKNSPILDKYLFGKDAGKYYDNSTGNRSPANMTSEGASNFVQDYAPKSPATNSSQTTTVAYSTPGNFNRSGSR